MQHIMNKAAGAEVASTSALGGLSDQPAGEELRGCLNVLIVDDHHVVAEALASRLDAEMDMSVIGRVASRELALAAVGVGRPDVVIVDLELRSDDPIEILAELRERKPGLPTVVMTEQVDTTYLVEAVRAGARAVVRKSESMSELVGAVRAVRAGEGRIPARLLTAVLDAIRASTAERLAPPLDRLTPREVDVLREMAAGHDHATVAMRLYLSLNTVRTHAKRILRKLGAHSSFEAVSIALRAGMQPSGRAYAPISRPDQ